MELADSSIVFSDTNTTTEVFIDFAKGNIVKYIMTGCSGDLIIENGYCDNTDRNIQAKCIISHKNKNINIKFVDVCWYDRSCYSICDGNIVKDTTKKWKYNEDDIEYNISMNRDEYVNSWNIILSKINPHYNMPELSVKILWHIGYWDGPFDGICEFNGKKHYFNNIDRPIYGIYELSDNEIKYEEYLHELFRTYVGHNTDYFYNKETNNYERTSGSHPNLQWDIYKALADEYRKDKSLGNYSNNKIVGWFIF